VVVAADPIIPRTPNGSDIYLNWSAGSDGSGSSGSPYNTWTNARDATLVAGQQLVVTGTGPFPDCTAQVSVGTSGNRIVTRSHPSFPTSGFTFSGLGSRTGGGSYRDYYLLSIVCANGFGFCFNAKDDFSGGLPATNWRVIDCTGTKTADPASGVNAGTGILYASNGSAIGAEVIRGSFTGAGAANGNAACLWFDYASNLNIVGVLIDNAPTPLYFKHTNVNSSGTPGGTVKNCIIRRGDASYGSRLALNWVNYLNNAIDNCNFGLDEQGGGVQGGNNCTLTHNSFLNAIVGCPQELGSPFPSNNTLRNNALLGTSVWKDTPLSATDASNSIDYTACEGAGTNHYKRNSTQFTLAGYHSTYAAQETNGVAGSIVLVGGSTPGSTAANWAMLSGVGKNASSDGTDCGVNASNLLTTN